MVAPSANAVCERDLSSFAKILKAFPCKHICTKPLQVSGESTYEDSHNGSLLGIPIDGTNSAYQDSYSETASGFCKDFAKKFMTYFLGFLPLD